jgi:hypothetical protein
MNVPSRMLSPLLLQFQRFGSSTGSNSKSQDDSVAVWLSAIVRHRRQVQRILQRDF